MGVVADNKVENNSVNLHFMFVKIKAHIISLSAAHANSYSLNAWYHMYIYLVLDIVL